ncbi:unnamed protein product [Psylliodes chrysocephalus]|uniref:CS domain-containing protein n=1 Tax=Psylliodes chrysocephalus TaxID=3402493 RepID=A0A9P0D398_9CUCU|nr:unnamed protein product [Psylliodes chrysocephala]
MPIVIKDYKWKQSDSDIIITVPIPLKNVHESKVDVFISSRFVKVSYEQYYFEAVLERPINKQTSRCTLTNADIVFELEKAEIGEWKCLEPNVSKKEKLEMKKQLLEESFKEIQEHHKTRSDRKHELKRVAVRKQIDLDSAHRQRIDDVRKMEEKKALGDLEEFRKKVANKLRNSGQKAIQPVPKTTTCEEPKKPIPEIPKTRATASLEIDFTPRQFPTPCRESKLEEEHEYLTKQAEARRSVGFVSEDIRPEERNPHFIKAKGDEFLKNKNYLAAISAYSFGITLSKNFVDLYISRSEAHMAQGNYWRAAQDCSTALELLSPICEANLYERALCTGRRGEALCELNMKKQGIPELEFSLKLIDQEHYREVLQKEKVLYENQLRKDEENREKRLKEELEKKAEKERKKKEKELEQKHKEEHEKQNKEKDEKLKQNPKEETKQKEIEYKQVESNIKQEATEQNKDETKQKNIEHELIELKVEEL